MAFDYFTIGRLARELQAALVDGDITDALHRFDGGAGVAHARATLHLGVRPSRRDTEATWVTNRFGAGAEALHLSDGPDRLAPDRLPPDRLAPDRLPPDRLPPDRLPPDRLPGRAAGSADTGVEVEGYLRGATIVSVEADRRERRLVFRLRRRAPGGAESYGRLIFELVHRRFQTILIAERSDIVIGVWPDLGRQRRPDANARRVSAGSRYAAAPNARLLPGEDDGAEFVSLLGAEGRPEALVPALTRHLCGADRHVVGELLSRAGVDLGRRTDDCGERELRQIWEEACALYATAPVIDGCFVWNELGTQQFSSLEPRRQVSDLVHLASVSEAVSRWVAVQAGEDTGASRHRRAVRPMRARLRALERKQRALQADLDETRETAECEKKGAVLLAHPEGIPPGAAEVELADTYDPSGTARIVIELDPRRSVADMAGRYLKRAAKLKKRAEVLPERLGRLEREIDRLRQTISACERGHLPQDQIDVWFEERAQVGGKKSHAQDEPQARPRRYRTSAGWVVWAGRNNRENDILTHRLAAAEDIWLHAHGYAGSHVVLRRDGRREQPSKRTLEEAAGVAAYWSKGRTANKVAVVYTTAKHVRKPRGAAPGLAVLTREKTILVRPQLLPLEDDESPDTDTSDTEASPWP